MFGSPAVARRSVALTLDELERHGQHRLRRVTRLTFFGAAAVVFLFGFFVGLLAEFSAGAAGAIGGLWIFAVPPLVAILTAVLVTVRRVTWRRLRAERQSGEFARNKAAALQRLSDLNHTLPDPMDSPPG